MRDITTMELVHDMGMGINRGIPVIIGEYGCPTKGKEPESVFSSCLFNLFGDTNAQFLRFNLHRPNAITEA